MINREKVRKVRVRTFPHSFANGNGETMLILGDARNQACYTVGRRSPLTGLSDQLVGSVLGETSVNWCASLSSTLLMMTCIALCLAGGRAFGRLIMEPSVTRGFATMSYITEGVIATFAIVAFGAIAVNFFESRSK